MKGKKSWRDKVNHHPEPEIKQAPELWEKKFGGPKMLISSPLAIEKIVADVPKGSLLTVPQLRDALAVTYNADFSCPLTTGIFLRIVAEANEEDAAAGKTGIAPYWRVVGEKGELNPKFPKGLEYQATKLEAEGHEIIRKSPIKYFVRLAK
jgi:hypothetical protein